MSGRNSATGNAGLRVLYDGWPLAASPGSPAALHLLELLEVLPRQIEPWLALPADAIHLQPEPRLNMVQCPVRAAGSRAQLQWEQSALPALARQVRARLIHTTGLRPPLFSPVPCLVSPAEMFSGGVSPKRSPVTGFVRLASALGSGGFSRAGGLLWPADLPSPENIHVPVFSLPVRVHSAFLQPQPRLSGLPETYVYAPAPLRNQDFLTLQESWQFIATGLGQECALLVCGMSSQAFARLEQSLPGMALVHLPSPTPGERASAVQHAAAVLLVSPVLPWGDGMLHALACARPLAGEETAWSDRRVGPAGFLTPPGSARLLSSAVITSVMEESIAEQLSQAAAQRSTGWQSSHFAGQLLSVYHQVLGWPIPAA